MSTTDLPPLPPGFAGTVEALHLVAERIVAPSRKPDNEIALEAAPGGFGTPPFEHGGRRHRVRVAGDEIVHEVDGTERRAPLTSLETAASAVSDLLPAGAELGGDPLGIDREAALALGEWYRFGAGVLARLAGGAALADAPTAPTLWPEHFDIAIEMGSEAAGARANYGLSPGDESHAEPYLYVGPWNAPDPGALWNATGFGGAEMGYSELIAAPDDEAAAIGFFETRREALEKGSSG